MKLLLITILNSVAISAQISPIKSLKIDSAKLLKLEKPFILKPSAVSDFDSSIAKLCKMPVVKPKNPNLYSSLKTLNGNTTLYKTPNLLDVAQPPKLAAK
ncbi:hypothetical protein [Chryseobacterium luquanense]|uniref:Uncharacterized protein n=1 Tax=Chryseobacterium luquanense TaxID=2983766 RepID=A0ABT3Y373_9FLAO|nr:hypothetical protein [Chryseobacterium luquanense]MCX8532593.1 hypothetical protein [Chryseobacterium luquanense]